MLVFNTADPIDYLLYLYTVNSLKKEGKKTSKYKKRFSRIHFCQVQSSFHMSTIEIRQFSFPFSVEKTKQIITL